jgi:putative aminopeptidase FrvX
MKRLRALLSELMLIPSLSGYEGRVRRAIADELGALGIASRSDRVGNLIATIEGNAEAPRVLLFAHMDQIGLVVRKIEANGLVRVERLGGVPEKALPSQSVLICVGKGRDVLGVIVADALAAGIDVGTPIVYEPKVVALAGDRIGGTSVDDRAGCAVIIEVARAVAVVPSADDASRLLRPGRVQPAWRHDGRAGACPRHRDPA